MDNIRSDLKELENDLKRLYDYVEIKTFYPKSNILEDIQSTINKLDSICNRMDKL